eukprot:1198337-Rhodomonas_salina.1
MALRPSLACPCSRWLASCAWYHDPVGQYQTSRSITLFAVHHMQRQCQSYARKVLAVLPSRHRQYPTFRSGGIGR